MRDVRTDGAQHKDDEANGGGARDFLHVEADSTEELTGTDEIHEPEGVAPLEESRYPHFTADEFKYSGGEKGKCR